MIKNFRHKGLRELFEDGKTARINPAIQRRVERILAPLDRIKDVRELDHPAYRLHKLAGDLKGFWSVSVSGNWRIIFRYENQNVYDVDFLDYH